MTARLGNLFYWLSVGVAVTLVAIAVLWNIWTFSQHAKAQRQFDALGVDLTTAAPVPPLPGSPEAVDLEILLEADRRGILDDGFEALLTEPQKYALAVARRDRLADMADKRLSSLVFGVILLIAAVIAYWAGQRARRR